MSLRWYLQTCVLPVLILTADRLLSLSSVCNAVHCAHCTVQRSTHYLVRTYGKRTRYDRLSQKQLGFLLTLCCRQNSRLFLTFVKLFIVILFSLRSLVWFTVLEPKAHGEFGLRPDLPAPKCFVVCVCYLFILFYILSPDVLIIWFVYLRSECVCYFCFQL